MTTPESCAPPAYSQTANIDVPPRQVLSATAISCVNPAYASIDLTMRAIRIATVAIAAALVVLLLHRSLLWRITVLPVASIASAAALRKSFMPGLHQKPRVSNEGSKLEEHDGSPNEDGAVPGTATVVLPNCKVDKRLFDIVISSLLLALASPLFLLIGLLIRLTSVGPIFFSQQRIGLCGRQFKIYKFRSMSLDSSPYACSPVKSSDPRITATGRILRKTGLDELPQLINVLKGQMSLVGPRPEMPFIVSRYNAVQSQRLLVLPGITGLWQLSTDRAYPIHESMHHDLFYIRYRTMSLDLAILIHTLIFAMCGGV